MKLQLKAGVRLKDLSPQMVMAALIVAGCYGDATCTITSANDSVHGRKSWHYKGFALDFRTKDYTGDKEVLTQNIKEALGVEFDVILESVGLPNEHLHVEYDPD